MLNPQTSRRQISAYLRGTVVVRPCVDLDNDGSLKSSPLREPGSGSTELESRYVWTRVRFLCIAHWCFNSTVFMLSPEGPLVVLISAPTAPDRLQPPLGGACVHKVINHSCALKIHQASPLVAHHQILPPCLPFPPLSVYITQKDFLR